MGDECCRGYIPPPGWYYYMDWRGDLWVPYEVPADCCCGCCETCRQCWCWEGCPPPTGPTGPEEPGEGIFSLY